MTQRSIITALVKYPWDNLYDEFPELRIDFFQRVRELSFSAMLYSSQILYPRTLKTRSFSTQYDISVPTVDLNTPGPTFEEATDNRVQYVIDLIESKNQKFEIHWSGGIDSTVMIAALYKHLTPAHRENLTIWLNENSYYENPIFFKKIIQPHFKYDTSRINSLAESDSIAMNGDPADAFWLQGNVLDASKTMDVVGGNVQNDPTDVINMLLDLNMKQDTAEFWLDWWITDARNCGLELYSIADVFWWSNFVHQPHTMLHKRLYEFSSYFEDPSKPSPEILSRYFNQFQAWYMTDEYQSWSMHAQMNKTKFTGSVRSYKMEAKDYIFEVDKNPYYRDYKSKMQSMYSLTTQSSPNTKLAVIYSDGTGHKSADIVNRGAVASKSTGFW